MIDATLYLGLIVGGVAAVMTVWLLVTALCGKMLEHLRDLHRSLSEQSLEAIKATREVHVQSHANACALLLLKNHVEWLLEDAGVLAPRPWIARAAAPWSGPSAEALDGAADEGFALVSREWEVLD